MSSDSSSANSTPQNGEVKTTSPTTSKTLTHLGTYPIISAPYNLTNSLTFHLPSKLLASLPAAPSSLDAAADQYLTQFDSAVDTVITTPAKNTYNTVVVKPRQVVSAAGEAYLSRGMEVMAETIRTVEDGVTAVGEHFLPEEQKTLDKKKEDKTNAEEKTTGLNPISYKEALRTDGLPVPGQHEVGGEGAEWTEQSEETDKGAGYKTALVEGEHGPQDQGADQPGGAGAEWPTQEHPPLPEDVPTDGTPKKKAEKKTNADKKEVIKKPTNPKDELHALADILQIYATRAYTINSHKSGTQLVHDAFGLTKSEFLKAKGVLDQQFSVERGYIGKMLEAGKEVEKKGEQEAKRMSEGSAGMVGMAKGAVGFGVGVVSGGVGVVRGVVGMK